jgi:hypothetical protein
VTGIANQLRPSCSCIQIEIGNFLQLDSHFRGDISTGCPVAASLRPTGTTMVAG